MEIESNTRSSFYARQLNKYYSALPESPTLPPLACWLQDNAAFRKYIGTKFQSLAKQNIFQNTFLERVLLQGYPTLKVQENGLLWMLLSLSLWLETHTTPHKITERQAIVV